MYYYIIYIIKFLKSGCINTALSSKMPVLQDKAMGLFYRQ